MIQGSDEWFQEKLGKLSASNMLAAISIKKDGTDYAERINLKRQIIAERLTGEIVPIYVSDPMKWGKEQEPVIKNILRDAGIPIEDAGFIRHPIIQDFGASPDGLIGEDGLVEVKCPTTSTHIKWLMEGVIPEEHKPQMLAQIACTGRKWCHFISFDPRIMNPAMRIFKRKFEPTEDQVKEIEAYAIKFLDEVKIMEELLADAFI